MDPGSFALLALGIGAVIGVSWALGVGRTPRDPDVAPPERDADVAGPESVPWTPASRRRPIGNAAIPMVPSPAPGWDVAASSSGRRRAPPRRRRVIRPPDDSPPDVGPPDAAPPEDVSDYVDDLDPGDAAMVEDVPRRVRQPRVDRGDRAPAGAVPRALGNYKWAISVAVMASWGGMFLAVGVAGIGAILGAVVGLLVAFGAGIGAPAWLAPFVSNSAPLAAIAGAVGGAVAGLGVVYGSSLAVGPGRFLTAAASGLVLAVLLTVFSAVAEGWVLRLRGARHMSTREADRIRPALQDAAAAVSGGRLPRVVMFDQPQVGAAMGFRHLMLNRGCLNLEDSELRGVLAHELHHWVTGDVVGTRLVWGAAWPVVVLYNLGVFLATDGGTVGRVAWVVLWPAAVIMRGVVGPALGLTSRQREYAADRAARLAGYGPALQSVLDMHRELEPGRTGWERVLNAEHPPTELRVDALLNPDVADTRPEIPVGVAAAGVLLVLAAVFGLWAVAAITPPGTGIRSAEPTAIPPTATPVPPSIAIRGTWEAVSYNGAPIPGASVTTLTFERRGIVLGHGARPVDNWLGSYRLLGPHRIAFDNGHSRWTAHYSVFGPDLETDVPGQRSVWRRIH